MADPVLTLDLAPLSELARRFEDAPNRMRTIVRGAMRQGMRRAENRARELVTGDVLQVRSGALRRSISSRVDESGDTILGRVGVLKGEKTLAYARAQEEGATITPKRAKVLTIPLKAALTPAGVPRFTAREAAEQYLTFWHKQQDGDLILYGYKGSGKNVKEKQLVPLFAGVTKVTLKPTRFLSRAVADTLPSIREDIQRQIVAGLLAQSGPVGAVDYGD